MEAEIPIFITMVQYDKELWKKLPQRKRAKWDASTREKVGGRASENSLLDYLQCSGRPSATITQISLNHAIRKILLSGRDSVAIMKNRSKGGSKNESKRPHPNIHIQTSKSLLIPLLPLKIISCWNGAIRKIYCTSFTRHLKTNLYSHKANYILYRSI